MIFICLSCSLAFLERLMRAILRRFAASLCLFSLSLELKERAELLLEPIFLMVSFRTVIYLWIASWASRD